MKLHFQCKICKIFYDYEVGEITFDAEGAVLEHYPSCPKCIKPDQWLLSELGQTILTEYHFAYMDKKYKDKKK